MNRKRNGEAESREWLHQSDSHATAYLSSLEGQKLNIRRFSSFSSAHPHVERVGAGRISDHSKKLHIFVASESDKNVAEQQGNPTEKGAKKGGEGSSKHKVRASTVLVKLDDGEGKMINRDARSSTLSRCRSKTGGGR